MDAVGVSVDATPVEPQRDALRPAEFAARLGQHHRVLWLTAAGVTGNSDSADDVLQEAALLALGKLSQFVPGTSFQAWMAQIVRFVALNVSRKRRRHRQVSLAEDDLDERHSQNGAAPHGPLVMNRNHVALPAEQQHFDDELMQALDDLKPIARTCLLLRTIDDLDYEQIAALLDIPPGTAMSHVHRARLLLRERLTDKRGMKSG